MLNTNFSIKNDWGSGFQGAISLYSDDVLQTNGWQISFTATFEINHIWGARIISQEGDRYTVEAMSWNSSLQAGENIEIGFTGTARDDNIAINNVQTELYGLDEILMDASENIGFRGATQTQENEPEEYHQEADPVFIEDASIISSAEPEPNIIEQGIVGDETIETADSIKVSLSGAEYFEVKDSLGDTIIQLDEPLASPYLKDAGEVKSDMSQNALIPVNSAGWFSTDGPRIVDENGTEVRLTGVNWFGAETTRGTPDGLHTRNWQEVMEQISELGFNTIRLPFSNEALRSETMPSGINYDLNPDLDGKTSLEIIDNVVSYAGTLGLRIILDNHRNAAGDSASSNGLWYGEGYSQADWIADWQMLAERYAENPTVVGFDISNEPHSASWGDGNLSTDWRLGAEAAIEAIHKINPHVLVIVEGIGGDYWWGGNLKGVEDNPIRLEHTDKLVYSPHAYPNSIYSQPWFSDPAFPENMPEVWEQNWGYIAREGIAPVLVGEFGSRLEDPKDLAWFDAFIPYMQELGVSWTFWSLNPNSGDTGGILDDDWQTPIAEKLDLLEPLLGGDLSAGLTSVETPVNGIETNDNFLLEDVNAPAADKVLEIIDEGVVQQLIEPDVGLNEISIINNLDIEPPTSDSSAYIGLNDVSAELQIDDNWGSGFIARGSTLNNSGDKIDGWSVAITTEAEITNIWNAQIINQEDNTYLIGDVGYNSEIADGGSTGWGFQASGINTLDYGDWIF